VPFAGGERTHFIKALPTSGKANRIFKHICFLPTLNSMLKKTKELKFPTALLTRIQKK